MVESGSYAEDADAATEEVTISYRVFLRKQLPGLFEGRTVQAPETVSVLSKEVRRPPAVEEPTMFHQLGEI
jgi:hypothetical protein